MKIDHRKYTKEILQNAVINSKNYVSVLRYLKENVTGTKWKLVKSRIHQYDIDVSHFEKKLWKKGMVCNKKLTPEQILISQPKNHQKFNSSKIKRAMLESGFLYVCSICDLKPIWNDKPLKLQIDHIDGNSHNHVISNLRFLCPNCHTQTSTYGYRGKSKQVKNKSIIKCRKIGANINKPNHNKLSIEEIIRRNKIIDSCNPLKWGWRVRVSKILGIPPQVVGRYAKRHYKKQIRSQKRNS